MSHDPEQDEDVAKLKLIYDDLVAKGMTGRTGHSYYAADCMHGRHVRCTVTCPYCTSPCRCDCHRSRP